MTHKIIAPPDHYFSNPENYIVFWWALKRYLENVSRRKTGDQILDTIIAMDAMDIAVMLFIGHWHQYVPDHSGRTISHILQTDHTGIRPKLHSKRTSLLQILCACVQFEDPKYHDHLLMWARHQELCNEE